MQAIVRSVCREVVTKTVGTLARHVYILRQIAHTSYAIAGLKTSNPSA
jgi:hypothetical protein